MRGSKRKQKQIMVLRNGKTVMKTSSKCARVRARVLRLRSRFILVQNIVEVPNKTDTSGGGTLKDEVTTPTPMQQPVPDGVPSSNQFDYETDDTVSLGYTTPAHILRAAMRVPVDAAVWGLLSDEDQHKLAMEGRAPIKLEMP